MKSIIIRKRKISILLISVSLFVIVLAAGLTIAYIFKISDPINNTFKRAVVSCEVDEVFDQDTGEKSVITVQNTGNIPEYIRVRMVSYWVDENDDPIAKAGEIPSFTLGSGWIDKGDGVYVYSSLIQPGESTPDLLGSPITLAADGNDRQVIEVFAEAIQRLAAAPEWGYEDLIG